MSVCLAKGLGQAFGPSDPPSCLCHIDGVAGLVAPIRVDRDQSAAAGDDEMVEIASLEVDASTHPQMRRFRLARWSSDRVLSWPQAPRRRHLASRSCARNAECRMWM